MKWKYICGLTRVGLTSLSLHHRMAPEVAAVEIKGGYNELCDIWSVGITAIELAELQPPMFDVHPLRYVKHFLRNHVIMFRNFRSVTCDTDSLRFSAGFCFSCQRAVTSPQNWRKSQNGNWLRNSMNHATSIPRKYRCIFVCRSTHFYSFVKSMLVRNPKKRPSASKMLSVSLIHCSCYSFLLICVTKEMKEKWIPCLVHVSCSTYFWPSSAWIRSWCWICWRSFTIRRKSELAWCQRRKTWRFVIIIGYFC